MGYLFVIWVIFSQSYLEYLLFLLIFSKFYLSDLISSSGYKYTFSSKLEPLH